MLRKINQLNKWDLINKIKYIILVNVAVLLTYKKRGFLAEIGPFIGNASQGDNPFGLGG
jgi:hypothetical protein